MQARAWAWWACVLAGVAGARELDPAACAARFDVQPDKIIRTEESRDMGARYLSELDVGARAECLRLCCETDLCDVFVYEEKGAGSCYLFKCGPPEDFRCKFTTHGNFSSGVLALSRRLAELQDQERQLAGLRNAASTAPSAPSTAAPAPAAPVRAAPAPAVHSAPATTAAAAPTYSSGVGACSRYQFACRRGGECIAVYNACDGVPQCADGSDEAPELGCPPARTEPPPARSEPPPARWPPRLNQAQPPAAPSHIFSHKGGLVAEAGGADGAPAWAHRWPARPGAESPWGSYRGREWDRAWPVPPLLEAGAARADLLPELAPESVPEAVPEAGPAAAARHTLRDSAKKGPAPPHTPAPPPPPPPPTSHHTQPVKEAAAAAAEGAAQRRLAADDDGPSERPPAAVLLLVLGVALTTLLGALAGCRARAASRRRRRGKPFAHDADYLVNGMYL